MPKAVMCWNSAEKNEKKMKEGSIDGFGSYRS